MKDPYIWNEMSEERQASVARDAARNGLTVEEYIRLQNKWYREDIMAKAKEAGMTPDEYICKRDEERWKAIDRELTMKWIIAILTIAGLLLWLLR